jgi:hypothetical protein
VVQRIATARQNETCVPAWYGDRDACWHQEATATSGNDTILPSAQIEAGIAWVGVGRQGEIGVESDDRHG